MRVEQQRICLACLHKCTYRGPDNTAPASSEPDLEITASLKITKSKLPIQREKKTKNLAQLLLLENIHNMPSKSVYLYGGINAPQHMQTRFPECFAGALVESRENIQNVTCDTCKNHPGEPVTYPFPRGCVVVPGHLNGAYNPCIFCEKGCSCSLVRTDSFNKPINLD